MCTVVFIPSKEKKYLASLRDESPMRATAKIPTLIYQNNVNFIAPIDPLANGSWLGANEFGNVIILLNGAFQNHTKKNNYQRSRGLIVTELLQTEMPVIEWSLLDLEEIEPFTLVVWSNEKLFELVWDGEKKYRKTLDNTLSHIWSSSTLYTIDAKKNRENLFENWIANQPLVNKLSLLNFFNANENTENNFVMNRNEIVKTLSYTFIEMSKNVKMDYYDFKNKNHQQIEMKLLNRKNICCI